MNKSRKILVFAGPSGGHLFPAFAFSARYRNRCPEAELALVTGVKGEKFIPKPQTAFSQIFYIKDFPLPRGLSFRTFVFLLQLARSFIEIQRIIGKFRPDLMACFGSYVAYPGALLGAWSKIPVLLHEQNVTLGRATRQSVPLAQFVGVTFPESIACVRNRAKEVVGLPLRSDLVEKAVAMRPRVFQNQLHLLVVGGSQGARKLNEVVLNVFQRLSDEDISRMAVTHITGEADFDWVRQRYQKLNIQNETYAYSGDMSTHYQKADLAVTRAGASTLFELALFKLPAIVVPYPYAESHQKENAEVFHRQGTIRLQEESNFNEEWLARELHELLTNGDSRRKMSLAFEGFDAAHAADKLVDQAVALIKEK